MKATGIVRQVDKLGRVVIPMEIRKKFDIIDDQDSFEIFVEEDKIILKKYQPCCVFCGEANDIVSHMGKNICKKCIEQIQSK